MNIFKAQITREIISSNSTEARSLHKKNFFGELIGEKIQYTLPEAMFLLEKNKIEIFSGNKKLTKEELFNKLKRLDKRFHIRYMVFKNLREKGYIVKTALKFGADFRVYEKGKPPGKSHAKWIVFIDHESKQTTWHEFSAKNRVAHSTRKKLLLAIVDDESDITYYEVGWVRP
jgi:tRNA-intron endonuclease, archaea type